MPSRKAMERGLPRALMATVAVALTLLAGCGGSGTRSVTPLDLPAVTESTEFAASRFRGGRMSDVEEMAAGASGDLGYAVWIERGEVTVEGRDEPAPLAVRVTHVFRREDGAWKIIHRHGDPITQITQAAAVVQG